MITAVDTNILLDVLIPGTDGMKTRLRARKLCEMACRASLLRAFACLAVERYASTGYAVQYRSSVVRVMLIPMRGEL